MDIFSTLIESFWSADAYKRAVFGWRWKSVLYFALISLIAFAGAEFIIYPEAVKFYDTAFEPSLKKLSDVKIVDGKISTPDNSQVFLKTAEGETFAVASPDYIDAAKTAGLLFAFEKDRLTFYMPDGSESFVPLKDYEPFLKDKGISAIFPSKKMILYIIVPTLVMVFATALNLSYLSMMSLATFIISRTIFPKMTFAQCVKLAMIALTPSIFLDIAALAIFGQSISGFFYALISGGLVYFMLKNFASSQRPNNDLPQR